MHATKKRMESCTYRRDESRTPARLERSSGFVLFLGSSCCRRCSCSVQPPPRRQHSREPSGGRRQPLRAGSMCLAARLGAKAFHEAWHPTRRAPLESFGRSPTCFCLALGDRQSASHASRIACSTPSSGSCLPREHARPRSSRSRAPQS